jgi:hypothetical protein
MFDCTGIPALCSSLCRPAVLSHRQVYELNHFYDGIFMSKTSKAAESPCHVPVCIFVRVLFLHVGIYLSCVVALQQLQIYGLTILCRCVW